ncbi:MAG: PTS system mannose/fructose/N-acetylgalactosamine-transporter subunit IIB [Bacilli bacterium]
MTETEFTAFVRVDDRLIHGQVVTSWVKSLSTRRIWVVSDRARQEPIEVILLKSSVPPFLALEVLSVQEAASAKLESHTLILLERLQDAVTLCRAGMPIRDINVGGLRYQPGRVGLSKSVYVGPEDAAALRALRALGVNAAIRVLPSDRRVDAYARLEQKWPS